MRELARPGGGYEEGHAAGKAAAGSWQPAMTTRLDKWREAVLEAPIIHGPGRQMEDVLADIDRWTRQDLLTHAAALHTRRMDALPDLRTFPELEGMDQYLDERARGFAAGAGIDIREVLLNNYWRECLFFVTGGGRRPQPGTCSEILFPRTPNGMLLGKGWDDTQCWYTENAFPRPLQNPPEPQTAVIPPQPDEGLGLRSAGVGNEAGLCMESGGGANYEREPERDEDLFPAPVEDLVMRSCETTLEAVEILTRYKEYWGPCNRVVVDAEGNGALFEKSKYAYAVRMSSRNVLATTYGGCDDEDMRGLCDISQPIFKYYERRLQVMKGIIAEAEASDDLGIEAYWRAQLHHDPVAPGCQHLDTMPSGVELLTFGAAANLPAEGRRFSRTLARDNGGYRYACENPAVENRYRFA